MFWKESVTDRSFDNHRLLPQEKSVIPLFSMLTENFRKIKRIDISRSHRHVGNAALVFFEKFACILNAQIVEILIETDLHMLFEQCRQMLFGIIEYLGKFR